MNDFFAFITAKLAASMDSDDLVEMLETAIAEYQQTQDFSVVEDVCVVILTKRVQKDCGAPEKVEEKLRQFSAPKSAFDHTQNKS